MIRADLVAAHDRLGVIADRLAEDPSRLKVCEEAMERCGLELGDVEKRDDYLVCVDVLARLAESLGKVVQRFDGARSLVTELSQESSPCSRCGNPRVGETRQDVSDTGRPAEGASLFAKAAHLPFKIRDLLFQRRDARRQVVALLQSAEATVDRIHVLGEPSLPSRQDGQQLEQLRLHDVPPCPRRQSAERRGSA